MGYQEQNKVHFQRIIYYQQAKATILSSMVQTTL